MYGLQKAFGDKEEKMGPTTTIKPVTGAASDDLTSISTVIATWLIVENNIKIYDTFNMIVNLQITSLLR